MASKPDFYQVYGPKADDPKARWQVSRVDCWQCLQPKAVTKKNRCYIPVRVQDRIDGSYATFEAIEDKMTRAYGYFCCWQCALGYCKVYFPNMCWKVHLHAQKHGFTGILAPTLNPRFVQQRFHPYLTKRASKSYDDLRPSAIDGMFMQEVPTHEQNTMRFADAQHVLEKVTEEPQLADEFPQAVLDSEQLMQQLGTIDATQTKQNNKDKQDMPPKKSKTPRASKASKAPCTKRTKMPTLEKEVDCSATNSKSESKSSQPRLEDFF